MYVSVIICTCNPREDYLRRTLLGLKQQTLPKNQWELLLIDNGSMENLAEKLDLSWHPNARHLQEKISGKTHALVKGINESNGDLIIIVDDDNILDEEYLVNCIHISEQYSLLGAWGGQWIPEYERGEPLEEWRKAPWIVIVDRDIWSNNYDMQTAPYGAGACFRREVALEYARLSEANPQRLLLGRKGEIGGQNEDVDMAFVACDLGLGIGRFKRLKLVHLIPQKRLEADYLLRLSESAGYSQVIMDSIRGVSHYKDRIIDRIANFVKRFFLNPMEKKLALAYLKGKHRAIAELANQRTI